MLWWQTLLLVEIVHHFIGYIIFLGIVADKGSWEIFNPVWIYRHNYVIVFGAIVLCIFANLLCPVVSIAYWFYKLCTVGGKKEIR